MGRAPQGTDWRPTGDFSTLTRVPRRRWWPRILAAGVVGVLFVLAFILRAPGAGDQPAYSAGSDAPPPGIEEAGAPLGTPPPAPPGPDGAVRAYEFLNRSATSTPVTFSPCRPIRYVVRPDNAPPGGKAMLAAAFKRLSAATGLVFINDGATDEPVEPEHDPYQPDRYGDRWAPVLVAWARETEVPDFETDVVGLAGPDQYILGDGTTGYVSGQVLLDAEAVSEIRASAGKARARAVLLHEFGHLVGLDHTSRDDQLMYPKIGDKVTDYAAGDLAGLARLGTGACQPAL